VVILYVAHVLEGGLEFNASVTQYCSDLGLNVGVRNFTVTNGFKIPVALVNVTLPKEAQAYFMVRNSFCVLMCLTVMIYSRCDCCFGQSVISRFLKHEVSDALSVSSLCVGRKVKVPMYYKDCCL
jgi:hypothetical protein